MKSYIGYIRVSTVKQGTKGVSLIEQRDAIFRYAERNQLSVSLWLEETETAAKQGRPIFNRALTLLRTGKAHGIILHKLDRGARNLRDWAAIGELSDQGVEIHFVTESLDLQSRGGRLSADIQAVVAADYIRNLREETRKGFYGRLKQGLYPLRAPLGYCDQGKGKPKTIDPVKGPLVRKAFELYATGRHSLETLGEEMHRLGLRNLRGKRVTRNGFSTLLNNPFYVGLMRIYKTNESFIGIHEPLIGKVLFDQVQAVLTGKVYARPQRHAFLFRRLLACGDCGYSLIGERQKGNVYYRCHTRHFPPTSIREEFASAQVQWLLKRLRYNDEEKVCLRDMLRELRVNWTDRREEEIQSLTLRLTQFKDRLNRLTDAYLDQALDKVMFEERRQGLIFEIKATEENLAKMRRGNLPSPDNLEIFLELAGDAWLSHKKAPPEEQREMVVTLTSNRQVLGKNVDLKPSLPFAVIADRYANANCEHHRDIPRTWNRILGILARLNQQGQLPDLKSICGFQQHGDASTDCSTLSADSTGQSPAQ